MVISIVNALTELMTRFKCLISTTYEECPQDNFLEALRQTLHEKDFKGSICEIHPIHSKSIAAKKSSDNISPDNSQVFIYNIKAIDIA